MSTTTETRTTLTKLAKRVRLKCDYGAKLDWDKQDDWQQKANGYRCRLTYKGRAYSFDFWMGSAHTSEPDAESVLECLLSDADAGQMGFEEFCGEFGYDQDSRKAERTWAGCQKARAAMERLLGGDFETFLYAERD